METISVVKGNSAQKDQELLLQHKSQTVPFTGKGTLLPWDRVLVTIKRSNFSDVWSLVSIGGEKRK